MIEHPDTTQQTSLLALIEAPPPVALPAGQTNALATLLEALLREIAAALASREVGHEQDHR